MEEKQIVDLLKQLLQKERSIEFQKLATDYIEIYATKRKRSFKKDLSYINRYLTPAFGNKNLDQITTGEIQKLHHNISKRAPIAANRAIEVLSKMFSLAIQWDYFSGKNPCTGVTHNREKPRERFLSDDEIKNLFSVIELESVEVRSLIYMYILTGRRNNELRNLKWADVNLEQRSMKIYDQKKDQNIFVPIPDMAVEILHCIEPHCPYVFAVDGKKIGLYRQWHRIRRRANILDVKIHDLRRTCATWMFNSGESLEIIAKILNHSSIRTTKVYAILKNENVKGAMNRLGDAIKEIRGV